MNYGAVTMAFLLRTINRAKWSVPDWMGPGDVPADALSDLRTQSNTLSVWLVDENQTNLETIIEAFAAGRNQLDKLDYTLITDQTLPPIPIAVALVEGNTP